MTNESIRQITARVADEADQAASLLYEFGLIDRYGRWDHHQGA